LNRQIVKMTEFIAIASGKGGVGKTTTAINLGQALTSFGKDVVVVDGNLTTPNIGLYLGIQKVPVTLHDVLIGKKNMADVVYLHSSGLKIIPGNISFEAIKTNGDFFSDKILELDGKTDIVLVDAPAGLGKSATNAIRASDSVIIVTTPTITSVADSLKTIKLAEEEGKKVRGVIINKFSEFGELTKESIESILNHKIIGIVPEDTTIIESQKINYPVVFSHPESRAAISFKTIAAYLSGQTYVPTIKKGGFFSRIFKNAKNA